MTATAPPLDAAMVAAAPPRPGYCGVHPNQRLVTHRQAGLRWYYGTVYTVCPFPDTDHPDGSRERCRWCGGRLDDPTVPRWRQSSRREYCSPNHRLNAFRARRRAAR